MNIKIKSICYLLMFLSIAFPIYSSLSGKKIGVDPGHGGTDPGSGCFGYWEKDFTLAVCLKLQTYLQNDGATVVMTRTTDTDVSLTTRYTLFNSNNCHISLCVHNNAAGCPSTAHGVETYYCSLNAYPSSSQTLATKVLNRDLQFVKNDSRGVKECLDSGRGFHYAMTRYPNMPATLSENYFITTEEECMTIHAPDTGRDKVARAHYAATCDYFGVPVNLPPVAYQAKVVSVVYPQSVYSGDRYQVQLYVINEGTVTWTPDKTKLVTVNPRERQSVFYDSTTWVSASCVGYVTTNVPKDTQYIFSFYIKPPQVSQQTQFTEYFNLYHTGAGYFSDFGGPSDTEIKLTFTVYPKTSSGGQPPSGGVGEFDLSDIIVSKSTFSPVNNETVTISYYVTLTTTAVQTLKIYNSYNTLVKTIFENSIVTAGEKSVIWDGYDNNGQVLPTGKYKIYLKLTQESRYIEKIAYVNIYSDKPSVAIIPLEPILNVVDNGIKTKVYINSASALAETKVKFYLYQDDVLKETVIQELLSLDGQQYYTILNNIPQDVNKIYYEVIAKDIYNSSTVVQSDSIKIIPVRTENINLVNGGNIILVDGNPDDAQTVVTIPPQQKGGDVLFRIEKFRCDLVPSVGNNQFIESGVDRPVAAYKIETIPEIDYFNVPIKLSLLYPDIDNDGLDDVYNLPVERLKIFCYKNSHWTLVGGKIDNTNKLISANIQQVSAYLAIFPLKSMISLHAKYFKPEEKVISVKNKIVSFKNISNFQPDIEIKIYDVKGRLIKTLRNKDVWDLTDNNNSLVPSGSYIYKYKFSNTEVTGVVTIIK